MPTFFAHLFLLLALLAPTMAAAQFTNAPSQTGIAVDKDTARSTPRVTADNHNPLPGFRPGNRRLPESGGRDGTSGCGKGCDLWNSNGEDEEFPDRILIGSDTVGHWGKYGDEITKYQPLLDALSPETATKLAGGNFTRIMAAFPATE